MGEQLEVVTVAEAAAHFGVKRATIYRWIKSGKLPTMPWPGGHHRIPRSALVGSPP